MIVCRHEDGRVVVMASEYGLKPKVRMSDGRWVQARITGGEFAEFTTIMGHERMVLLQELMDYVAEHG